MSYYNQKKKTITLFLKINFCLLLTCNWVAAQSKISGSDFSAAFGKMKGTLTYLDYSSRKPFTMPANITLMADENEKGSVIRILEYPEEPRANGRDTIRISNDGSRIDGARVVSNKKLSDDIQEIITEEEGKDGNDHKQATIRHIYTIGKNRFSIRKEVKFTGTDQWIKRNEYLFSR